MGELGPILPGVVTSIIGTLFSSYQLMLATQAKLHVVFEFKSELFTSSITAIYRNFVKIIVILTSLSIWGNLDQLRGTWTTLSGELGPKPKHAISARWIPYLSLFVWLKGKICCRKIKKINKSFQILLWNYCNADFILKMCVRLANSGWEPQIKWNSKGFCLNFYSSFQIKQTRALECCSKVVFATFSRSTISVLILWSKFPRMQWSKFPRMQILLGGTWTIVTFACYFFEKHFSSSKIRKTVILRLCPSFNSKWNIENQHKWLGKAT